MRHRVRAFGHRHAVDLVVLALAAGGVVEFLLARSGGGIPSGPLTVAVPAILAMTLPLLARNRFPFGAPALAITSSAGFSFAEGRVTTHLFSTILAGLAIAFLMAYSNDRRRAAAGLFLVWTMAGIAARNDAVDPGIGDIVFVVVVHTLAWLTGLSLNQRREQERLAERSIIRLEREREERARAAVEAERSRIARELHDVVGHHLSVMTVQAGAARRVLRPDQERERQSLEAIERTGREALGEMRRMVGVLRGDGETPALSPQPDLDRLPALVEHTIGAGLAAELRVEGQPVRLPAGVGLAAYRIVQEGLTNALKHADARSAQVVVCYGDQAVELTVEDDGMGSQEAGSDGHGHVGMRERVALYGGELQAGPRPGGGYRLHVRLPLSAP